MNNFFIVRLLKKCFVILLICGSFLRMIGLESLEASQKTSMCIHRGMIIGEPYEITSYTHSSDRVCYNTLVHTDYKCDGCGEKWYTETSKSSTSHAWKERFDHEDGRYTYYIKVCLQCDCKAFSRKVEGPVQWTVDKKTDIE